MLQRRSDPKRQRIHHIKVMVCWHVSIVVNTVVTSCYTQCLFQGSIPAFSGLGMGPGSKRLVWRVIMAL